jgi:hypothetical protein
LRQSTEVISRQGRSMRGPTREPYTRPDVANRTWTSPVLPSFHYVMGERYIATVHWTFVAAAPLSFMGFAGWLPVDVAHSMVLGHSRALPTTV